MGERVIETNVDLDAIWRAIGEAKPGTFRARWLAQSGPPVLTHVVPEGCAGVPAMYADGQLPTEAKKGHRAGKPSLILERGGVRGCHADLAWYSTVPGVAGLLASVGIRPYTNVTSSN